jgi:hypothetical protein
LAILIGLLEFIEGLAILLVKLSKGCVDEVELDLLFLEIMISLLITGSGFLSRKKSSACHSLLLPILYLFLLEKRYGF